MTIVTAVLILRGFYLAALRRKAAAAALLCVVIVASGCRGNRLFPVPGPIQQQQANAIIHDPYPLPDIGPSDLGSRPPGYEQPLPEPVRQQDVRVSMPWLGR